MDFGKGYEASLIRAIYNGRIGLFNLPKKLYKKIAEHLFSGVSQSVKDEELLIALKENVYLFSAAKTFQYVLSTKNLIVENDEIVKFKVFKERAQKEFDLFNKTWLESEYETAIGQGQSAANWKALKDFDLVKYVTIHDSNTSEVCNSLDGIILQREDLFWDIHAPLNHYRCRCLLQGMTRGTQTNLKNREVVNPTPEFANNPGKSGKVFDDSHPYYDVPKQYKKLAKRNFDLPI